MKEDIEKARKLANTYCLSLLSGSIRTHSNQADLHFKDICPFLNYDSDTKDSIGGAKWGLFWASHNCSTALRLLHHQKALLNNKPPENHDIFQTKDRSGIGLDALIRDYAVEASFLSNSSDLSERNSHFIYIWQISNLAILPALNASLTMYINEADYLLRADFAIFLTTYIVFVAFIVVWYKMRFVPFLKEIQRETHRAAALLSFLPSGVDLEGLKKKAEQEASSMILTTRGQV